MHWLLFDAKMCKYVYLREMSFVFHNCHRLSKLLYSSPWNSHWIIFPSCLDLCLNSRHFSEWSFDWEWFLRTRIIDCVFVDKNLKVSLIFDVSLRCGMWLLVLYRNVDACLWMIFINWYEILSLSEICRRCRSQMHEEFTLTQCEYPC